MSGFLALIHSGQVALVDFQSCTSLLSACATEAPRISVRPGMAFSYSHLDTGEATSSKQPFTLTGLGTIAGDIRLDDRRSVLGAVTSAMPETPPEAGDAELVLRAYCLWAESSLTKLRGDFSFAIFDERRNRLFCARDHFGVRPLHYVHMSGRHFVCSNVAASLHKVPGLGKINPSYVADYLAYGYSPDFATRPYFGLQVLPPAHYLVATIDEITVQRYWTLPVEPEIRYGRPEDYVDHFVDALGQAVRDRTRSERIVLSHSGGLDSNTLAALLLNKIGSFPKHQAVLGHCTGWNVAFRDPEPAAAQVSAQHMGLDSVVWEELTDKPTDWEPSDQYVGPEPTGDTYFESVRNVIQQYGAHSRIAINGQGADEVLMWDPLVYAFRTEGPVHVLAGIAQTLRMTNRLPPSGVHTFLAGLWERMRNRLPRLPEWLNTDLVQTLQLEKRFRGFAPGESQKAVRGRRLLARRRLALSVWPRYLEQNDPAFTGVRVQTRWPFLDLRVVSSGLALPNLPWCSRKQILREALRPVLPPTIVQRPKTALVGDPLESYVRRVRPDFERTTGWSHRWIEVFVDIERWRSHWEREVARADNAYKLWSLHLPLELAAWLRYQTTRPSVSGH